MLSCSSKDTGSSTLRWDSLWKAFVATATNDSPGDSAGIPWNEKLSRDKASPALKRKISNVLATKCKLSIKHPTRKTGSSIWHDSNEHQRFIVNALKKVGHGFLNFLVTLNRIEGFTMLHTPAVAVQHNKIELEPTVWLIDNNDGQQQTQ